MFISKNMPSLQYQPIELKRKYETRKKRGGE
jgi:hypothetical protein